jgi:hypothetical protein
MVRVGETGERSVLQLVDQFLTMKLRVLRAVNEEYWDLLMCSIV